MGRYDDRGGGAGHPEQMVPAGLAHMLAQLAGPHDYWDRPGGDFGPLTDVYALGAEASQRANSLYRLGSKALRRGELGPAADCLGAAAECGHPGALFKLAALACRSGGSCEDVRFLVAEAARHGHGDARLLLSAADHAAPAATAEDPEFFEEIRSALGVPPSRSGPDLAEQTSGVGASGPGKETPTAGGSGQEPQRLRHDTCVPARPYVTTGQTGPPPADSAPGLWAPPRTLWTPPAARPAPEHQPREWESALRVLDVLHLIHGSQTSVTVAEAARTAGVTVTAAAELMSWLSENSLTSLQPDGSYTSGPLMQATARGEDVLQQVLDRLREDTGAAIYVSAYTDGNLTVTHASCTAEAPKVEEYVPFRECAHASAVGKSILSQLSPEAREDHLSRWRPVSLTARTITDPETLYRTLDKHGPAGSHFDVMEYCDTDVCAAIPLPLPGQARCVALSLPLAERHRLTTAARILSNRSTGLLLAVITAAVPLDSTPPSDRTPQPAARPDAPPRTSGLGAGLFLPPRLHDRLVTPARLFIGRP
ncbi:IclR family transcriptional regulator C-terminal domain-containing protein [Streptomyces sp. NPDC052415]|uniref:IclR family transcriptional regulator domain-containing protein n=1 Tax=Streptomyces sp. NPDC052415 TaxID=3365690 RepID=UPI0037D89663